MDANKHIGAITMKKNRNSLIIIFLTHLTCLFFGCANEDSRVLDVGTAEEQFKLGQKMLSNKNYQQAFLLFEKSAEKGYDKAQNDLGSMYLEGIFIEKDLNKAFRLFSMAAEQGNPHSKYNLGNMYLTGIPIERDIQKAKELFFQSAEKGNAYAQNQLGCMYYNGTEIIKDYHKAFKYFSMSAKQGDLTAFKNLGYLYAKKDFEKKDLIKSYSCFSIAKRKGENFDQEDLNKFEEVKKYLNTEQLKEAEKEIEKLLSHQ